MVCAQTFCAHEEMPKAKVQEQEVPVEEAPEEPPAPTEEAPEELPPEPIPEVPVEQPVPKPRKAKAPPTAPRVEPKRKAAPKRTNLKVRHTCGACDQEVSLLTALCGHKNCPGKVGVSQPPALVRQVATEAE